ncbi:hypothetical protein CQA49_00065 [Helicobacter sp. MIT 00-7814]|uniref:hypothetical protein n=1 Tax=unclassified Helicobacter TaxID=2593540 RepID=UPI000E1E4CE8|nr:MULTISPECIES: hypothetical protein [unclassified Helicobacter]RDU57099.1 hypothetical protein CQA49_00065 [Helicobacter sp. MIT 00-7814]RDU57650.1 hypothetical protein CQA37_00065 [Helicobacter sp. MIT 99-10781]
MAWYDGITGKKQHNRFREQKKQKFREISAKYELGLSDDDFKDDAQALADAKYSHRLYIGGWKVLGNYMIVLITSVVAIIMGVATLGSSAPLSAAMIVSAVGGIVGGVVGIVTASLENFHFKPQNSITNFKTLTLSLERSALEMKNKEQEMRLTHSIIFGKYEIYASNSTYLLGRAGSEDFSPTCAFDSTRGLRGEKIGDEITQVINKKSHTTLAGNKNYLQNLTQSEIPIKTQGLETELIAQTRQYQLKSRLKQINQGAQELVSEGFGTADSNRANNVIKRVSDKATNLYKTQIRTLDTLEKLKNYSLGLRADFDFVSFSEQTSENTAKSKLNYFLEMVGHWDKQEQIQKRDTMPLDELAKVVLQCQIAQMEVFSGSECNKIEHLETWERWENRGQRDEKLLHTWVTGYRSTQFQISYNTYNPNDSNDAPIYTQTLPFDFENANTPKEFAELYKLMQQYLAFAKTYREDKSLIFHHEWRPRHKGRYIKYFSSRTLYEVNIRFFKAKRNLENELIDFLLKDFNHERLKDYDYSQWESLESMPEMSE